MDTESPTSQSIKWFTIWEAPAVLQAPFTATYADLDTRELWLYLVDEAATGMTYFDESDTASRDVLITMKLLCPTLWCGDYFPRDIGHGTHTGLDIILPQNTPIVSFTDGEVIRIKARNGTTKDE